MPIINEELIIQEYKDKTTEELSNELILISVKMTQLGEPGTKEQCFKYAEAFARLGVLLDLG